MKFMTGIVLFIFFMAVITSSGPAFADEPYFIDIKKGGYSGEQFGNSCEGLGDINNDGYNDFLTSSLGPDTLYLYLGGPAPFDNEPVLKWPNHGYDGEYAFSPVNVGDMDCDGTTDFITAFDMGNDTLRLYLGLENLDANDYITIFEKYNVSVSHYISGHGDNNGDGRPEFWLCTPPTSEPFDYLINGYSGCEYLDNIPDFSIEYSRDPDNHYGNPHDLCSHCDINGDGIPDIIYGQIANVLDYAGRICVIWGNETLSTVPDLKFYCPDDDPSPSTVADYGHGIVCLGDISGDGIDDIWVNRHKRNYIYFGGNPFDTIADIVVDYDDMSPAVAFAGDINDDGYNDVALLENGELSSGISYIYCQPGMDTLIDAIFSLEGFHDAWPEGGVVEVAIDYSWAGDINGDGIDDVLISAFESYSNWQDEGLIYIQSGKYGFPLGVADENPVSIPDQIELSQNYPNPFNSGTVIKFTLPRSGFTTLSIYNLLGDKVVGLVNQNLQVGEHKIAWEGNDDNGNPVATGVYFYRITSGDYSQTKKMILLK